LEKMEMKSLTKLLGAAGGSSAGSSAGLRAGLAAGASAGLAVLAALPGLAQEAAVPVPGTAAESLAQAAAVSGLDSGDTAWMLVSTLLVLFMILPGVALFYGGLVRSKNVLSILMQCTVITGVVMILYVLYGYSLAFGGSSSAFWGGLDKVF